MNDLTRGQGRMREAPGCGAVVAIDQSDEEQRQMRDLPDEWKWLDEMPEEWGVPDELEVPTENVEANLAIKLLSCAYLGWDCRVELGRFVTEQALFVQWYYPHVAAEGLSNLDKALLADFPMQQTRRVYEAWKEYEAIELLDVPAEEERRRRQEAEEVLHTALRDAVWALQHKMGRSH